MEVFFKNLSADETPTESLIEDAMLLVKHAEDMVDAAGESVDEETRAEVKSTVARLKQRCRELKEHAVSGARHTDHLIRANPYTALGLAFGTGLLLGFLLGRRSSEENGLE